jgi:hypothetical protein
MHSPIMDLVSCAKMDGVPYQVVDFFQDHILQAQKTLGVLGEVSRFLSENLRVITKFQNKNGGFRRSIYLGISDFDTTYYALGTLSVVVSNRLAHNLNLSCLILIGEDNRKELS